MKTGASEQPVQFMSMLRLFLVLTVLTGIVYPLLITAAARLIWPDQSQGSLLRKDGQIVGSALIGQSFSTPRYFWGRPSATTPQPYNAAASTGSNIGPTNAAQIGAVRERVAALRAADPTNALPIPVDLVTASASGLDPHITPAAAYYQSARVARERGLPEPDVRALIARYTEGRTFGVLGEPRVNVLKLNLALDALR